MDACADSSGCDICPDGPIVDDSKVVTGAISEKSEEQTASCAEWFLFGCTFSQSSDCTGVQEAAAACCTKEATSDSSYTGTALAGATIGLAMLV